MIENEIPAGAPNKSCGPAGAPNKRFEHTRRFSEQKLRMPNSHTFMQRNARTWKYYDWSMVSSPTFLILWFWSVVLSLKYWTPVFGPLYWVSMVLVHGLSKGLSINMKGDHLVEHLCVEYLKVSKLWNSGDQLVRDSWIWIKEKPELYKADLLLGRDLLGAWSDL